MKLITKTIEKNIPKLYADEEIPLKDKIIYAHYMAPLLNFDWFVYEYDHETKTFFGFANLNNEEFAELGYFTLQEFEEINKEHGFNLIERDVSFTTGTTEEISEQYPVLKKLCR